MKRARNGFFKNLHSLCMIGIIALGLMTIIATGGGGGSGDGSGDGATSPDNMPPVIGPDPSYQTAVFYYPWYGTPDMDGEWVHWGGESDFSLPLDIRSDYYPILGAYSSVDPAVVAQHFSWLREAGIGVIISSWWGQGSPEDQTLPVLLEIAERYEIKVAFHIEPYSGRTAEQLMDDVDYLYANYGDYAAFCRTTASSRWSPHDRPKGLFFVWLIDFPDNTHAYRVEASYWQEAVDAIHASPDGGIVVANTTQADWIDGGHFDGLYNYATLDLGQSNGFSWAQSLPPDAWYVPSVIPGFSARRIGYPEDTYVPRLDSATYNEQWEAALGVYVKPEMVTVTSFNEWHEGSQIEPAAEGVTNGLGYSYKDYSPLPPEAYLRQTHQWVEHFLDWNWPTTCPARIRMTTTSDWTTLSLVSGGAWLRPSLVSASEGASEASVNEYGLHLMQPLEQAQAEESVEMVVDILFAFPDPEGRLEFKVDSGQLGATQVVLMNYQGLEVGTFEWSGINLGDPQNPLTFLIPVIELQCSMP